jgi:hypothetical protein
MIQIEPPAETTVHDKLTWAYSEINYAITEAERRGEGIGPLWSNLQDCRRNIREAMQMLRDGRKPV